MFDWNDEELANIIWGEDNETDDHIVPYPNGSREKPPSSYGDHIKKELYQDAANVKAAEQKKPVANSDFDGGKLESKSQYDTAEVFLATGFGIDSWPDLSLSNAAKTDPNSVGTEASNNLTDTSKHDSSRSDETDRPDNDSEIFQNRQEDKEESDLVDYGWANIGSFDDLDRIFSNDDLMLNHVSLGNSDELWTSSKDAISSPERSIPLSIYSPSLGLGALRSTPERLEKEEYVLDQDQPFNPCHERVNDFSFRAPQNVQASMNYVGYAEGKSKLLMKDKTALESVGKTPQFNSHLHAGNFANPNESAEKVNRQRKLLKNWKKSEEKRDTRQLKNLFGTWSPSGNQFQQFDGHYAVQVGQPSLPPVLSEQEQLQGPESLQYKHISHQLFSPYVYGNMGNQYSAMQVYPQFHFGERNHQQVPSSYEISPGNSNPLDKSVNALVKPLTMTPQEKIEKLRRRQQMRAMLAIQKQQQQLSQQVSCTEQSTSQNGLHDARMDFVEGGNIKVDENLSSLDPNSPIEQDDSNTLYVATDKCSVEDTILYRLQDIIAKLDIQMRLCIRDSLSRLAQSALQRQYVSDTSSTNKSSKDELEVLSKEEISSHNSFAKMPDVETQTNPIDRTVAHLLFHRPPELSGRISGTPDSPVSTKLSCERKTAGRMSLSTLSHQESTVPRVFAEGDHSKSTPCLEISENASNNESADGGVIEVQASQ